MPRAETAPPVGPRRPGPPVVVAVTALVVLVLTWVQASQRPVPSWELDLERWFNAAPDWVAALLWPVMQAGTIVSPLVVALVLLLLRRRWMLPIAVVVAGFVAWYGAKGIKELVRRGRPREHIPDIDVREGAGTGLGYVSGHSAVSAALAVILVAVLPPRWRWAPVALAGLVGVARLVYGEHLPADVVGGWATGMLIGLVALAVTDRRPVRRRSGGPVR